MNTYESDNFFKDFNKFKKALVENGFSIIDFGEDKRWVYAQSKEMKYCIYIDMSDNYFMGYKLSSTYTSKNGSNCGTGSVYQQYCCNRGVLKEDIVKLGNMEYVIRPCKISDVRFHTLKDIMKDSYNKKYYNLKLIEPK